MSVSKRKRKFRFVCLVVALIFCGCDHTPNSWKKPNMISLSPRLQNVFAKTKAVCFGRFVVEVPAAATVVWGEVALPLDVEVYIDGAKQVADMADKFIADLKSEKAINQKNVPLLLSVDQTGHPEGRLVTGYESFESINGLKISGFFSFNKDGVVIRSRPMREDQNLAIAEIKSIANRLRQRLPNEIPSEPGNCLENGFLLDRAGVDENRSFEHVRIGVRLDEIPDAHFSIYVAPSNPDDPEGDSLKRQFDRIRNDPMTPEEAKVLAATRFLRESTREIGDWKTGYEVLMRSPDEDGSHTHHDFQAKFLGVARDPYKPYADIQLQTGVSDNAAGATKASLTDEEALAVWDKITSSIRVRPTTASPNKNAHAESAPRLPLGELAATGRTCPQTGWWQADEAGPVEGGARRYFKSGERMPHVMALGEPSLWQKLKGERPSYRSGTVWKLVSYDDAPAQPHAVAAASPAPAGAADPHGSGTAPGKPADGQNGATLPDHKG